MILISPVAAVPPAPPAVLDTPDFTPPFPPGAENRLANEVAPPSAPLTAPTPPLPPLPTVIA
nr:MAG TPA: hypothetical protein [Caudoviricetes sp.]